MTDKAQTETEPTPEEIAEKLAARIIKGKQILDATEGKLLNNLKIEGKTLKQWAKELTIKMPKDSDDLQQLEATSTEIATAIQKAEYILAAFELQASVASNFHDEGFARRYVATMEAKKGEGRIAADKLRQMVLVDSTVDSSLAASQAARVVVDYFKRLVKGLEEARKGLENRTRLIGLRVRFLQDHG